MPSAFSTRRSLLRAACLGVAASVAGCSGDAGDTGDTATAPTPSTAATDTRPAAAHAAASDATTHTTTPDCDALSYEPTLHSGSTTTPDSYLTIEATLDRDEWGELVGYIEHDGNTVTVTRTLSPGENVYRFGPYSHDSVGRFDFWLAGCGSLPTTSGEQSLGVRE